MLKFLKGVVGGSGTVLNDLPFIISDPYLTAWGSWTHHRGFSKEDGSSVSVFSLSAAITDDRLLAAARNGVKRLRTVRHPNIVAFLHSAEFEVPEGSSLKVMIYVVTEPVMPLSEKIKELSLEGMQRDEYCSWGLLQIAKAVNFLNNDCKLVHGNVCLASAVVTPSLDWKLHAFDVLSEFDGSSQVVTGPVLQYEWLVESQYKPMELVKCDWNAIRKSPPWSIDSWGFGCLIYELFSGAKLCKTEDLRNTTFIPKTLLQDYQRLLSSMPSRRLNTAKLIEHSEYFQNKLVDTIHFMEILNLKDSVEKDVFFRKLPNLAEQLPREIVLRKLLPMLTSALEFGSAVAPALTSLLTIGTWLLEEEFRIKALPTIIKLFVSNDRAIRVCLLQHIDQYGEFLSTHVVDEQIYRHVATGFNDTSPFLRELTLKSMLVLAPKLSQRTISGSFLKYLSKLQVDDESAIRTNTTILLGNIASYLSEGTRKRVLINAFTVRALRDTFPPARGAGLMALCATSSYFDVNEVASRILPHVVALTIDADRDVRTKAFQTADQFLQLLKQHHEKTSDGDANATMVEPFLSLHGNTSLLGWAISSLTHKGKHSEQPLPALVSSDKPPVSITSSLVVDASSTMPVLENSYTDMAEQSLVTSPSMDGWGEIENGVYYDFDCDKDGWDDIVEEPLPKLNPIAIISNVPQKFTSNLPPLPKPCAESTEEDGLWGHMGTLSTSKGNAGWPYSLPTVKQEDDPWAAIAAPPPSTSIKPLSTSFSRKAKTKCIKTRCPENK